MIIKSLAGSETHRSATKKTRNATTNASGGCTGYRFHAQAAVFPFGQRQRATSVFFKGKRRVGTDGLFAHRTVLRYKAPMRIAGVPGDDAAVVGVAGLATAGGIVVGTQSSQTGPIIAGVVAVVVALITWYATDKRQAKAIAAQEEQHGSDLRAESARHDATLRAERERLDARLAHERELADVADLRLVLGAALDAADLVRSGLIDLVHGNGEEEAERQLVSQGLGGVRKSLNAMGLRLPDGHPVLEAHGDLLAVLRKMQTAAYGEDRAGFQTLEGTHTVTYGRAAGTSQKYLGSRLPSRAED
jgi:hypothetical protein